MTMRLQSCQWSEEAARVLKPSCKWFPLAGVEDYRLILENEPTARLYRCEDDGELVGFLILKIDHYTGGSEGVILAAAAKHWGVDLVKTMLPAVEGLFQGVCCYSVSTARPGLVRKLQRAGWVQTHAVLRKIPA